MVDLTGSFVFGLRTMGFGKSLLMYICLKHLPAGHIWRICSLLIIICILFHQFVSPVTNKTNESRKVGNVEGSLKNQEHPPTKKYQQQFHHLWKKDPINMIMAMWLVQWTWAAVLNPQHILKTERRSQSHHDVLHIQISRIFIYIYLYLIYCIVK